MDRAGEDEADAHESSASAAAIAQAAAAARAVTDGLEEFDLDNYDEDDEEGMHLFSVLNSDLAFPGAKDPLMTGDPDSESDDDSDDDIKPDDQVFIATSCEEESQQLEVFTYVEEDGAMYVHHDIMLSAYPLCIEYLDQAGPGLQGCYGAVGLIDNSIQIWDLEDSDPVEPASSLGTARKKKGKSKSKKRAITTTLGNQAHDGAVMCLHGSIFNRNVLASGSADETLKVWDVTENKCVHTYSHHGNKVQTLRWHPTEKAVLCSAGFDGRLALMDVRQPGQAVMTDLPAEAESVMWSRHSAFECLASVDNGGVVCYDVRKVVSKDGGERLWTLMAHDVACTAISDAPTKDLLLTAGLDGQAKVWNIADGKPSLVLSKDLKVGPLFACQSNAEAPALMCFGGHCPVMWDLTSESVLTEAFGFPCEDAGLQ